jgi:hypothetical protein
VGGGGAWTSDFPADYLERVKTMHESGGHRVSGRGGGGAWIHRVSGWGWGMDVDAWGEGAPICVWAA